MWIIALLAGLLFFFGMGSGSLGPEAPDAGPAIEQDPLAEEFYSKTFAVEITHCQTPASPTAKVSWKCLEDAKADGRAATLDVFPPNPNGEVFVIDHYYLDESGGLERYRERMVFSDGTQATWKHFRCPQAASLAQSARDCR